MRTICILTFAVLTSIVACKKSDPTPVVPNPQDSTQHQPQDTTKHPQDTTQHPQDTTHPTPLTMRQTLDSAYRALNGKQFLLEYYRMFVLYKDRDSAYGSPAIVKDSINQTTYNQKVIAVKNTSPSIISEFAVTIRLTASLSHHASWTFYDTIYVNNKGEKFIAALMKSQNSLNDTFPRPAQASAFKDYRLSELPEPVDSWFNLKYTRPLEVQYYFEKDSISIYRIYISGLPDLSPDPARGPRPWHERSFFVGYGKKS